MVLLITDRSRSTEAVVLSAQLVHSGSRQMQSASRMESIFFIGQSSFSVRR